MKLTGSYEKYARVYAEVNLDAIRFNLESMKGNICPETKIMAVIKADGYGHGAVEIAREVEALPYLAGFATATFEEAVILRKCGIQRPILILGYVFPYCYEELIQEDIRPALFRPDMAEELSRTACEQNRTVKVHIKVDTGMSRIGVWPDESGLAFVKKAAALPNLEIEGIFTHFATADMTDKAAAERQRQVFAAFVKRAEEAIGRQIPIKHCSNSAGIVRMQEANMDMVRAGITLYGLWPSEEVERDIIPLKAALSLKSRIVYTKEVGAGVPVSYGGTFVTGGVTRIATIPVGYADGYPRSLSSRGQVLVCGRRAPILGRVCMDQMMVDVSPIPEAVMGSEVTLLGADGEDCITAEELGKASGRFNYELVCDISKRVPRVYVKGGRIVGSRDYYEDFV